MADAKKEAAAAAPPAKKGKLLIIIISVVVLLLIVGGGGVFYMLQQQKAQQEALYADDVPERAAVKKKRKPRQNPDAPPVFTKLESFVVKLQSPPDTPDSYVQATPELKLAEAAVTEQVNLLMPEIRHKLLLIIAGKTAADLSTPQGMQALANQIRVSINASLTGEKPAPNAAEQDEAPYDAPVQGVFFSSLIIQ